MSSDPCFRTLAVQSRNRNRGSPRQREHGVRAAPRRAEPSRGRPSRVCLGPRRGGLQHQNIAVMAGNQFTPGMNMDGPQTAIAQTPRLALPLARPGRAKGRARRRPTLPSRARSALQTPASRHQDRASRHQALVTGSISKQTRNCNVAATFFTNIFLQGKI